VALEAGETWEEIAKLTHALANAGKQSDPGKSSCCGAAGATAADARGKGKMALDGNPSHSLFLHSHNTLSNQTPDM